MRDVRLIHNLCLITLIGLSSVYGVAQLSVLTQHNDNSRSGQNLNETYLNTSNVNVSSFGKLFSLSVDGYLYAQPLYVPNLTIQGQTHNVVYVATEHNSVYAFDADDPSASTPLWHVDQTTLGTPVPSQDICQIQVPDGCAGQPFADVGPEIGITSTPVIDPSTDTIYVVSKTKTTNTCSNLPYCNYHFFLHALDLLTGSEKFAGPVEITIPSSSPVPFTPLAQLQRPGLLLLNGAVYVAFGSAGDLLDWHGWVVGYDASTLQQLAFFDTTPGNLAFDCCGETGGGGIFAAGQGLIADGNNNIYFTTGNGPFNVNTGGSDYGDSALKLSTSALNLVDYFAPFNAYNGSQSLGYTNTDLGAGGLLLIPGTTLLVGGGKDGILRLIDSTNMGKFDANRNQDIQEFQATSAWIMGSPVYWNGPLGQLIYLWASGDVMKAWKFNGSTSTFQTSPVSLGQITSPSGEVDTSPVSVSANGNLAGTGILWAPTALSSGAIPGAPGILHALDASNVSNELWNSQMATGDNAGNFAKFNPPTIANGKVYLPTFSGQLLVYGLTSPYFSLGASPSNATVISGSSTSYAISVTGVNGFSSPVSLACSGLPSGASCSFNPPSVSPGSSPATSTVTVSTVAGTAANTYNVTITGTSGSVSHDTSVSLIVQVGPTPDFAISATSPVTVSAGASVTSAISITAINGFNSAVNLACGVAGGGTPAPTCSLSPSPISGSQTSTLTIATATSTPAGTYSITVTGTSGPLAHPAAVMLTVTHASGSFSLSSPTPASAAVTAGSSATFTVTVTPSGGFTGNVTLNCTIATSARPAPVCSSTSVMVSGALVQATLTVSTTAPHASLQPSRSIFYAMLLPLVGMTLMGAAFRSSRKKKLVGLLLMLLLISGLLFLAACGGGSASSGGGGGGGGTGGTPAGTFVVTVTGTSGSLSAQATTFTLSVQ